jgi:hypothetical protein
MTEKASPAGWVVQVTIQAPLAPQITRWIGKVALAAPSFKYFNVAISTPSEAIEATSKHLAGASLVDGTTCVVRELSSREIAALSLEAGEVKPA